MFYSRFILAHLLFNKSVLGASQILAGSLFHSAKVQGNCEYWQQLFEAAINDTVEVSLAVGSL